MARRGENIRKRTDGRWEGRYIESYSSSGKACYCSVYGATYTETKEKLKNYKKLNNKVKGYKIEVIELCREWLNMKKESIKISTLCEISEFHIKTFCFLFSRYENNVLDLLRYSRVYSTKKLFI